MDADNPTRPEIVGTFGVVSSTHWIPSQVGMAALERGPAAADFLKEMSRPGKPPLARLHAIWGLGQRGRKEPDVS